MTRRKDQQEGQHTRTEDQDQGEEQGRKMIKKKQGRKETKQSALSQEALPGRSKAQETGRGTKREEAPEGSRTAIAAACGEPPCEGKVRKKKDHKDQGHVIHVLQIYRSAKRCEHSIEELFAALDPWLQGNPGKPAECIQDLTAAGEADSQTKPPSEIEIRKVCLPEADYRSPRALWRNVRFVRAELRQHPAEVIHITGEVYFLACFLPRDRTILTLHDFVYLDRFRERGEVVGGDPLLETFWVDPKQGQDQESAQGERPGAGRKFRGRRHLPDPGRQARYLLSYWFWHRIPFARCRKIICVSDTVEQELWDRFPELPRKKTCVIPNTVGAAYEAMREEKLDALSWIPKMYAGFWGDPFGKRKKQS